MAEAERMWYCIKESESPLSSWDCLDLLKKFEQTPNRRELSAVMINEKRTRPPGRLLR